MKLQEGKFCRAIKFFALHILPLAKTNAKWQVNFVRKHSLLTYTKADQFLLNPVDTLQKLDSGASQRSVHIEGHLFVVRATQLSA